MKRDAMVQSVDPSQRTLALKLSDGSTATYKVGQQVENLDQVKAGDKVNATVAEELTVYVLKDGMVPGANGASQTVKVDAKVQLVDPSYRLLTVQYPSGQTEILKPGLEAKMLEMEPGDSVVIKPVEVTKLSVEN